jgi:hypothetical protein
MRSIRRNVAGILAPSLALVMAVSAAPVVAQAVADGRGPEGRAPVAGVGADAPAPPLAVMPWAMPTYEIPALLFETDRGPPVQDALRNGWVVLTIYGFSGAFTGFVWTAIAHNVGVDMSPWRGALVGGLIGAGLTVVHCQIVECDWSRPGAPSTRRRFPPGVTHLGVGDRYR